MRIEHTGLIVALSGGALVATTVLAMQPTAVTPMVRAGGLASMAALSPAVLQQQVIATDEAAASPSAAAPAPATVALPQP